MVVVKDELMAVHLAALSVQKLELLWADWKVQY